MKNNRRENNHRDFSNFCLMKYHFGDKVKHLSDKILSGRNVESRLFTLDDM